MAHAPHTVAGGRGAAHYPVMHTDAPTLDRLFPEVYEELEGMARRRLRHEPSGLTLNTVDLVHEAYLKLLGLRRIEWQSRSHVLALAAQAMRRVLIDHARAKRTEKRGGERVRVTLEDAMATSERPLDLLLAIEEALQRLEAEEPRYGRVVECRFFAGLSIADTAAALDCSPATVKRDWSLARSWLHRELAEG